MARITIEIPATNDGLRLDLALVEQNIGLSRRRIRSAIDAGGVYVNKKRVRIASRTVRRGDIVVLEYDPELKAKQRRQKMLQKEDLIHLGPDFVIVNKPAGMPSQATRSQSQYHLAEQVKKLLSAMGESRAPALVHRLDAETSGVMILALTKKRAEHLYSQFSERRAEKKYIALVAGLPLENTFSSESRLSFPDKDGMVRPVTAGGREAKTLFEVRQRIKGSTGQGGCALIVARPHTGRTHQIRVHLAMMGLPIIGDKRYGRDEHLKVADAFGPLEATHHLLHSQELKISIEAQKPPRTFRAPTPPRFLKVLKVLTGVPIDSALA